MKGLRVCEVVVVAMLLIVITLIQGDEEDLLLNRFGTHMTLFPNPLVKFQSK